MENIKDFLRKVNLPMHAVTGEALEAFKRQREEEDRAMVEKILRENEAARKAKPQRIFDKNSLIPPALKKATFDNYKPTTPELWEAKSVAIDYVTSFNLDDPQCLMMMGSCGVGKSHLAVSILKHLIGNGFTGIFITVPELLTKIKATYNKESNHTELELLEVIKTVDCLVLDDIGAEYGTSWALRKLFEVIDSRSGRHTIYTTNLNMKELKERFEERDISRMKGHAELLTMEGPDYRDTVLCRRERR